MEYNPQKCFRNFVRDVSDARVIPLKLFTRKLEDNSAYVSTIINQENFQNVKYVHGEGQVVLEMNKPQYEKVTNLIENSIMKLRKVKM